jgi:glycine/D-amino acid oxidase-like deaminating enzyme
MYSYIYLTLCSFLHPLSPRGKLVFLGLEALTVANDLIGEACTQQTGIILRDEIYKLALEEEHTSMLQKTAENLPESTQWIEQYKLPPRLQGEPNVRGALRLHAGSKVIHVPSYLRGLWKACEALGPDRVTWECQKEFASSSFNWKKKLMRFDGVVLSAGSGLIGNLVDTNDLPITLVRGQSVELVTESVHLDCAMLGGKYVSPLPEKNRILIGERDMNASSQWTFPTQTNSDILPLTLPCMYIRILTGATHEFQSNPWDKEKVIEELKERSYAFSSSIWDNGSVDTLSTGVRVQSNRSRLGRVPIIGRYESCSLHENSWIFTGLSSRGLLYHGLFGKMLSSWILSGKSPFGGPVSFDVNWWKNE